jgi:hypothetical protein
MEVDWVLERFKEGRGFLFLNLTLFVVYLFIYIFFKNSSYYSFPFFSSFFRFTSWDGFLFFFCILSIIHRIVPLRRHFPFGIFYLLLAMGV